MASKILIIGATGAIGTPITAQIVAAKSSFSRIAILTSQNTLDTKPEQVAALKAEGVDVLVGDLTVEKVVKGALEGELLLAGWLSVKGRIVVWGRMGKGRKRLMWSFRY
jgi:nucleoside-diphosphate-sugar epimerase